MIAKKDQGARKRKKKKKDAPRGIVLWRGHSLLTGAPIVVIATLETSNRKTGDMVQTWILLEHTSPTVAINTGEDEAICGSCPLRGLIAAQGATGVNRMRGCYVAVRQAPLAIWGAYRRGAYAEWNSGAHRQLIAGRMVRLGAYGDPAAVPVAVWRDLLKGASGWAGYTHSARDADPELREYVMASCQSIEESRYWQSQGWRTFRISQSRDDVSEGEIYCPADRAEGRKLTCEACGACNGARRDVDARQAVSVVIAAHGSPAVLGSIQRVLSKG